MPQQLVSLLPIILMFVIFYFLIIRPQQKKDKKIKEMRANLKTGNQVITIGGIYGKILNIHDDIITIEVGGDKVKLKMGRWAIAEVTEE
jgi:preprotein translocase subunit YajC